MARLSYTDAQENNYSSGVGIEFFTLRDDGDEAIVRILHDSVEDFDIVAFHDVTVQNRSRKVDCLRSPRDPMEKCPFCNAGYKTIQRIYIHLLQYEKDDSGNIVVIPKIWERSTAYANTLKNLIDEYGPLSDCIFKIHRDGAKGDMNTKYSILFGNPNVYIDEYYPKDTSAFDDYSVIGTAVMSKDADEMNYYLEYGEFENTTENNSQPTNSPVNTSNNMPRKNVLPPAPTSPNRPQRFY